MIHVDFEDTEKDPTLWNDAMTRSIKELADQTEDLSYEVNTLRFELEKYTSLETKEFSLKEWKKIVLRSIPVKASLKFRLDVEEFLDKIKAVY